jgi:hypothetical protein
MEPCGASAYVFRGVDSSPATITVNFLLERNELISTIKLDEKCSRIVHTASQGAMWWQMLFRYPRKQQPWTYRY